MTHRTEKLSLPKVPTLLFLAIYVIPWIRFVFVSALEHGMTDKKSCLAIILLLGLYPAIKAYVGMRNRAWGF